MAENTISPPSLCLLTIGSFATLYNAWVNYPRTQEETPLLISDIILDIVTIGVSSFGVDWFYNHGLKLFSWIISIFPILLIITVAVIVIIRVQTEKNMTSKKISSTGIRLCKDDRLKIKSTVQQKLDSLKSK
jgi:hypothetical protein